MAVGTALLWPAIAQAALTGIVYLLIGIVRRRAVRAGEVTTTDFPPWDEPADSAAVRRHLVNQFEMPVLFFVVIGFLTIIGGVSSFEVIVAWAYFASRVAHSIGALRGPLNLRHGAFTIGTLLLALLWLSLIVRLIKGA